MPKWGSEQEFTHTASCHHEAGHAVVAKRLGVRVLSATMDRNGGDVLVDADDGQEFESLVIAYAGMEAEVLFLRKNGYSRRQALRTVRHGCRYDLQRAAELADEHALDEREAQKLARSMTRRNWGRIKRVGAQLARRGRVSARAI